MTNTQEIQTESIYVTAGDMKHGDQMNSKVVFPLVQHDPEIIELVEIEKFNGNNTLLRWRFGDGDNRTYRNSAHAVEDQMLVTRQVR